MSEYNGWNLYARVLSYVKPFWWALVLGTIGSMAYGGVDAYATYLLKSVVDKGFIEHNHAFLKVFPFILVGLFLLRGAGNFSSTYFMGYASRGVVYRFRQKLYEKILVLPASYFDSKASGQLLARLTYNVDQITQATGSSIITLVREGCAMIGCLIVMFVISWRMTLITFVILPFVIAGARYASKRFRTLSKRIQTAMGDVIHTAEETIAGYRDVRLYNGEQQQLKQFTKITLYNYQQEMKVILTDGLYNPLIQLVGSAVLGFVIYLAFNTTTHLLSAGSIIAFLGAMIGILRPIRNLSGVNSSIQKGLAAAEGIFEIIDQPEEPNPGKQQLAKVRGEFHIESLSFRYQSEHSDVLQDINLHIRAGQTIAFVGRSGSGKSTLMSLLTRFYTPGRGRILLDGVDIADLELQHYRAALGMVSQHVILFDNTVRYNISYGKLDATEAEIIAAAKAAYAWEFIEQLPMGLDTRIGENGLNLSGGQRQRLALARAILKNAPVLILDEATSALDNESERAIQAALEELKKGRTTLVVAHRLSTIEKADMIVVMDQGKIAEKGSHEDLLAQKGIYAQLHQSNAF